MRRNNILTIFKIYIINVNIYILKKLFSNILSNICTIRLDDYRLIKIFVLISTSGNL